MSRKKKQKLGDLLWDALERKSNETGIPRARLVCGYARQPMNDHGDYYTAHCALTEDYRECSQKYGITAQDCPVYKRYFKEQKSI